MMAGCSLALLRTSFAGMKIRGALSQNYYFLLIRGAFQEDVKKLTQTAYVAALGAIL
jgi:hypothetical protein